MIPDSSNTIRGSVDLSKATVISTDTIKRLEETPEQSFFQQHKTQIIGAVIVLLIIIAIIVYLKMK